MGIFLVCILLLSFGMSTAPILLAIFIVYGVAINATINANKNAIGNYSITMQSYSNVNYNLTAIEGVYKITQREIEITIGNQASTYGEEFTINNSNYTTATDSVINGDNLNVVLATNATANSNAGNYDIYIKSNNSKYKINATTGTLTINPRTIHINVDKTSMIYGDTLNLSNSQYHITDGEIINNDQFSVSLQTNATENSGIGSYQISAQSSNNNYAIVLENCEITVSKRKISIQSNQIGNYGSNISLDNSNFIVTNGNIVNNDNLGLQFSTTAEYNSNVGSYPINMTYTNQNYDIDFIGTYTIKPKLISVAISNQSQIYGNIFSFNNQDFSFDNSQLVEGDNLNITLHTSATNNSNAGNYPIRASIDNNNYKLLSNIAEYKIEKRKLTIKLLDQTIKHTIPVDINNSAYEIIEGTIANNDNLNIFIYSDINILSFAGKYKLAATYNNKNYDITFENAQLNLQFYIYEIIVISIPVIILGIVTTVIIIKRRNRKKENWSKW